MIQLDDKHKKIIDTILKSYPSTCRFFIFGSRARGDAQKFSDIDLAFEGKLSSHDEAMLKTALEESNLPFTVDLVNLKKISPEFSQQIKNDLILWSLY